MSAENVEAIARQILGETPPPPKLDTTRDILRQIALELARSNALQAQVVALLARIVADGQKAREEAVAGARSSQDTAGGLLALLAPLVERATQQPAQVELHQPGSATPRIVRATPESGTKIELG